MLLKLTPLWEAGIWEADGGLSQMPQHWSLERFSLTTEIIAQIWERNTIPDSTELARNTAVPQFYNLCLLTFPVRPWCSFTEQKQSYRTVYNVSKARSQPQLWTLLVSYPNTSDGCFLTRYILSCSHCLSSKQQSLGCSTTELPMHIRHIHTSTSLHGS